MKMLGKRLKGNSFPLPCPYPEDPDFSYGNLIATPTTVIVFAERLAVLLMWWLPVASWIIDSEFSLTALLTPW